MNKSDTAIVITLLAMMAACFVLVGYAIRPYFEKPASFTIQVSVTATEQTFQDQPAVSTPGGGVLQRCYDGRWIYFTDPGLRWTDGNLALITGQKYEETN